MSDYQSAFFTVQRDMSPNLKLALDILSYSGMVSQLGTVKIAGGTAPRYLVNLALVATEKAFDTAKFSEAISRLSLTRLSRILFLRPADQDLFGFAFSRAYNMRRLFGTTCATGEVLQRMRPSSCGNLYS